MNIYGNGYDKLLEYRHEFEIKHAIKERIKQMGIFYKTVKSKHKWALIDLAEAYAIFCGIRPHTNSKLIAARWKDK